jgi:subfamily B ATP-binding cassette protein MsbA
MGSSLPPGAPTPPGTEARPFSSRDGHPSASDGPHGGLAGFFWHYYRRHLGWVLCALIATPVYGLASAGLAALIEPIFADVLVAGDARPTLPLLPQASAAVPSRPRGPMPTLVNVKALADGAYQRAKRAAGVDARTVVFFTPLLLLAIFLLRGAADVVGGYAFQRVGLGVGTDVRNDLYGRLLEQSGRFHAAHPSGALISHIVSDVSALQGTLSSRLFDIFQQSITLVLLLALLLSTDLSLALVLAVAAPPFLYLFVRFGKAVRASSGRSQARMADIASVASEGLRGHAVVAAFGAEAFEHRRFRDATSRHLRETLRLQRVASLAPGAVESLAMLGATVFLIYAGIRIRSGQLSAPILIQFMATAWLAYDPIRKLNGANLALQQMMAIARRIVDLMAVANEVRQRPGAHRLGAFRDAIRFDHVTVAYGSRRVVDDVSFIVARGDVVALVGPSGAGKTTLASLVPRFFDPDEGRVTIDGRDVRDLTLASLRRLIGVVSQHTILFDDTIRANIAYARPDVPFERVEAAARAAHADHFIRAQPLGYETRIGESGVMLSGGERQRIAIARALLKDAPILILDEATSQLDGEARLIVHDALRNLMAGRTVIMIAHDLTTAQAADRILVLENGQVVESGRHEDLMAQEAVYRRMFEHWAPPAAG